MNDVFHFQLDEYEDEPMMIGLLSLVKKIPYHEFFFKINELNNFQFKRVDDFVYEGQYFSYRFAAFRGYSEAFKTDFTIISNHSTSSEQRKPIDELFTDEQNIKYLLNNYQEVEFIIKSSDVCPDFSVILMPENTTFAIKEHQVQPTEELYDILFYYE